MTAVLLGSEPVHSPEWHALRAGGIGASEIAAVAGLSPYQSPFHLWHVKKGNIDGPKLSNAMDWGNRLEPVVFQWFREQHPDLGSDPTPGTFAHAERPWQRCNPDGLLWPVGEFFAIGLELPADHPPTSLLQIKTSRYGDGFGPSGSDQIPLHYACQVQWEMDVFGVDHCWLAVLIGGNDPREYRIAADPEGQATLREVGARFWQSLQDDTEPPLDATDSTYEAVRNLHPDIDREATVEIGDLFFDYLSLRKAADQYDRALQETKSQILAAMGTARTATNDNRPVLRRQMSSTGTPYLKEIA